MRWWPWNKKSRYPELDEDIDKIVIDSKIERRQLEKRLEILRLQLYVARLRRGH
jgi:hypothetical protein